jgi:hypothetical protein
LIWLLEEGNGVQTIERSFILVFCIQFFRVHVDIVFQCALAFVVERKIVLTSDACSRPPIIIKFHNLHASDIKRAMGEITYYHKRD